MFLRSGETGKSALICVNLRLKNGSFRKWDYTAKSQKYSCFQFYSGVLCIQIRNNMQ